MSAAMVTILNNWNASKIKKKGISSKARGHEDVWCEVCSKEYEVLCTHCGPMEVTSDNPVIMEVENRAQNTLPTSLYIILTQHYHPKGLNIICLLCETATGLTKLMQKPRKN